MSLKRLITYFAVSLSFQLKADCNLFDSLTIVATEHKLLQYKENSTLQGPTIEILRLLLEQDSLVHETQFMPWPRAFKTAKNTPDTLILSMVRTKEREPYFHWITRVSELQRAFVALTNRPDSKISNVDQAKAKLVAVVRDSYGHNTLKKLGFTPEQNLYLISTMKKGIHLLLNHKVDLLFTDPAVIKNYYASHNLDAKQHVNFVVLPETKRSSYIALNINSNDKLVEKLKAANKRILALPQYHHFFQQKALITSP